MSVVGDALGAETRSRAEATTVAAILGGLILAVIAWHVGWVAGYGYGLIDGMATRVAETPSHEEK